MKTFVSVWFSAVLILIWPSDAQDRLFERDVYPIFQKRCAGCHFPEAERLKSGLDLSTAESALAGGNEGVSIVPGDVAGSRLIDMLEWKREPHMPPPDKHEKLPPEEIEIIRQWIANGAKSTGETPVITPGPAHVAASTTTDAAIGALAFAERDGAFLLARGTLHTVEVLRVSSDAAPEQVARLDGHADMVRALAFSPDGGLLAVGGGLPARSGEVKLWSTQDWKVVRTLEGHRDNVLDLAFSPDGARLVTVSYDKTAIVWDLATGGAVRQLKDHVDAVYAVAFSPDGKRIATGAGDRTVKVWDAETGAMLLTVSDSLDAVYSLAFSPVTGLLAGAGADKMIRVWDVGQSGGPFQQSATTAGTLLRSTFAHQGGVLEILFAPDGKTLYSAGEDRLIKAWDPETLSERRAFEPQPEWITALALSRDGRVLAAGRFDATHGLYDSETASPLEGPRAIQLAMNLDGAEQGGTGRKKVTSLSVEPVIIRATVPPSFGAISPDRTSRGETIEVTVNGKNLDGAEPIVSHPSIRPEVIEIEALPEPELKLGEGPRGTGADIFDNARPYRLKLRLAVAPDAPVGPHEILFRTPLGLTNGRTFTVTAVKDVREDDPGPDGAQRIDVPSVIAGRIGEPGDTDRYRMAAKTGQEWVFALTDTALNAVLVLRDDKGAVVASNDDPGSGEARRLGARIPRDGEYVLEVSDKELRGGIGYRLHAGEFPYVLRVWPLGVRAGAPAQVAVTGFNVGTTLEVQPAADLRHGATIPLPIARPEASPIPIPSIAVGVYDELLEAEPNDVGSAQEIAFPSTVNGRIELSEDGHGGEDVYRFAAKAGQVIYIETMAARLGSPLDSVIEVLEPSGRLLQRGSIRCVAQTYLTLADRDSRSAGLRIDSWNHLRVNDYVMVGSEIIQLIDLPDYADEDATFRAYPNGQRMGLFGTTPQHHAVNTPVYTVEIHPPDTTFAPNGMPVFPLYWRNDDGFFGDGDAGGDSFLEFIPPADGEYLVRVRDVMGRGREAFAYRLMLRPPAPDFDVIVSPGRVNISRGSRVPVTVRVRRIDGFDRPVRVAIEDLPPGYRVAPDVILPGEDRVELALEAGPEAESTAWDARFPVIAAAELNGEEVRRETRLGAIAVNEVRADLDVVNGERELAVAPGQSGWVSVRLDRFNGFDSRVPIDVLNLPFGVRVMDTGLNGILVREGEHDRAMEIYVEPWVKPMERTIYIQARIETPSARNPVFIGEPITLRIGPSRAQVAHEPAN